MGAGKLGILVLAIAGFAGGAWFAGQMAQSGHAFKSDDNDADISSQMTEDDSQGYAQGRFGYRDRDAGPLIPPQGYDQSPYGQYDGRQDYFPGDDVQPGYGDSHQYTDQSHQSDEDADAGQSGDQSPRPDILDQLTRPDTPSQKQQDAQNAPVSDAAHRAEQAAKDATAAAKGAL